jgi:hypothetical protein
MVTFADFSQPCDARRYLQHTPPFQPAEHEPQAWSRNTSSIEQAADADPIGAHHPTNTASTPPYGAKLITSRMW